MSKTYPRLERRKLAKISAGKRPYKNLTEKRMYTRMVEQTIEDNGPDAFRKIQLVVDAAGVVSHVFISYGNDSLPRRDGCKTVGISQNLLVNVVACVKDGKLAEHKALIEKAFVGAAEFAYSGLDDCIARQRAAMPTYEADHARSQIRQRLRFI